MQPGEASNLVITPAEPEARLRLRLSLTLIEFDQWQEWGNSTGNRDLVDLLARIKGELKDATAMVTPQQ